MKYKRYRKEEKDALMVEWQTSGTSRSAFAQQHGLSTQTFINWTNENRRTEVCRAASTGEYRYR